MWLLQYDLDSQGSENPNGSKIMFKKLVGSDDRVKVEYQAIPLKA